jgi:tetratricopeptide (TPR) repeat protein
MFLFAGYLTEPAQGGNSFGKADSLFLAGNYYPASVEYERAAFLSSGNAVRTLALLKKAECLQQTGNFTEAEKITERIVYTNLSDTLIAESHYQGALCSYLAGNFSNAENHLLQMHTFIRDSSLIENSLPLYALVLNELQRWPEAKEKALKAINNAAVSPVEKDTLRIRINKLYTAENYPHMKNLLKAQKMSAFLPGLGQLYAGYFWEGAASAFLNVASVGFMVYCVYTKLYFTGVITGSGVFSKFYTGGSNRLEYLVGKRNYKVLRKYNDQLKSVILNSK